MEKKTKKENDLAQFLTGLAMLCVGGYAFANNVSVHTGFYRFSFGTFQLHAGLVVVPFVVGIIMLFVSPEKFISKLVTGLGLLIIVASVIMGTSFTFQSTSLYVYLLMLIGMFGGLALVLKVLLKKPAAKDDLASRDYGLSSIDDELDHLKKRK